MDNQDSFPYEETKRGVIVRTHFLIASVSDYRCQRTFLLNFRSENVDRSEDDHRSHTSGGSNSSISLHVPMDEQHSSKIPLQPPLPKQIQLPSQASLHPRAQLLAQARSAKDRSSVASLAKSAAEEADRSIKLDPKDVAAHILLALALDLQGFKTSALDAIDVVLSPLAAKLLSGEERGNALFKRAEIKVGLKRRGRVDSVVEDLVESVRLKKDNVRSFCLLGEYYEMKEMKAEAQKAYEDALRVEPNLNVARQALDRLRS